MWIRFVLVPGLTDDHGNVERVADLCAGLRSVNAWNPALPQMGGEVAEARPGIPAEEHRPPDAS